MNILIAFYIFILIIIELCKNINIPYDWALEGNCVYGRKEIKNKVSNPLKHKLRAYKSKIQYISHNNDLVSNIVPGGYP